MKRMNLEDIDNLYSSIIHKENNSQCIINPEQIGQQIIKTELTKPMLYPFIIGNESIRVEDYFSLSQGVSEGVGLHLRNGDDEHSSIGYVSITPPYGAVKRLFRSIKYFNSLLPFQNSLDNVLLQEFKRENGFFEDIEPRVVKEVDEYLKQERGFVCGGGVMI